VQNGFQQEACGILQKQYTGNYDDYGKVDDNNFDDDD
jgi:hypothetical protein